ncbi:MAG: hypothetical protein ACI4MP_12100 [Candidatus Ventricola sp.]
MKHIIVNVLVFLILLCPAALAQGDPPDGLIVEEGWVRGTVTGVFGADSIEKPIKVDCPLPEDPYPAEILTLKEGYVSKKQMQSALRAAGQSTQGQFVNLRGTAMYTGDWRAEAAADISNEEAAAQAVRIGLAYFEALGVEVDPVPRSVSRPYDFDAYMARQTEIYEHRYSDPTALIDNARAHWKRRMKYEEKQPAYTAVYFNLMVGGMRLWSDPAYPAHYADEPDAWEGFSTGAHVIVSDSGVLVEAACDLFEMKARRPIESDAVYADYLEALDGKVSLIVPAQDWQDALRVALADPAGVNLSWGAEEQPYQNQYMTEPVTTYGFTTVVTAIRPFLSAISRSDWVPFWRIETTDEFADGWRRP